MIESELSELLERAGERTDVGPPPIEAMRAGAARRRRRRAAKLSAVGVAAAAVAMGGTTLIIGGLNSKSPSSPVASTRPGPAATRLVGIGHAAIAVPEEWGTNQSSCGTPQEDTVVIDLALDGFCQKARPKGVESVEVASGRPTRFDFHADETFDIDGVRAERQRTGCTAGPINHVTICSGAVFIPSLDVSFRAESTTNIGEVNRILAWIMVVPDQIGVPEPEVSGPDPATRPGEKYAEKLTALGLKPKIRTSKFPSHIPGDILAVSPSPGTMLTSGTTVTVTVVA